MLVFTLGVLPLLKLVWCQESGTEYTPGISQNDTDCQLFSTKGRDYRGIANTTVKGVPCQHWSATQFTHVGEHNFCRNPVDSGVDQVWCYANTTELEWDYCAVHFCPRVSGIPFPSHSRK